METALPIVAGIACGILSGAPYAAAMVVQKRTREASILPAIVAVGVSLIVIAVSVLVAWLLLGTELLGFALALVAAFFVVVVAGVVWFSGKPRGNGTCEE